MKQVSITKAVKIKNQRVKPFDGEKDYLATGGLVNGNIETEKITYKTKPSRADFLVNENQLIVARMKETNKVLLIDKNSEDLIVSTGFLVLDVQDGWHPDFLFHYFVSNFFQGQKDRLSKGATQKAINNEKFKEILIPEISYEDQKRIAEAFTNADDVRKKRKQSIGFLDDYLKSAFIDMFGDPITNKKRWPRVELKDLCGEIVDCPHSTPKYAVDKTDYPCIRSSDMQGGFLDFSATKYIDEKQYDARIRRCRPDGGDIIYCREGARFGVFAYLPEDINASLGQRTMLLRAKTKIATGEFLWGLMNSQGISHQAGQLVNGAASPHINVKDIKKYSVFQPPLELQKKYSKIFLSSLSIKQKMLAQSEELEAQFQALVQRAFKGEL